jgi:peptidoglycan-N-acetylmuramic acid deacetylase
LKNVITILLVISLIYLALSSGAVRIEFRHTPSASAPTQNTQQTAPADKTDPVADDKAETTPADKPDDVPPETTVPAAVQTDGQLLRLSNEAITYGPGPAKKGEQPPYAPEAQKEYGKYDVHFIEDDKNTIYLTFDCGYDYFQEGASVTGMILDVLKEKGVKAIFFVTGDFVRDNPEMVQRILDEGHALGNHSSEHRAMPGLTIREMEEQILTLHEIVEKDFGYTMKFFRPPDGAFSLRSLAVTRNAGYETVHWSFAYGDYDPANQPDPAQAKEKILASHHDGAIYLLHALSTTNAQILGDVIDEFRAMGYRLSVLS